MEKWQESFKVRSFEVGTQGLVTPQSLCKFLQEAAGNHAAQLNVAAEKLQEQDLMWVLSRLRLQVLRTPAWHETISIETWPTTRSAGIRAHRDFQLFDVERELLGQASSMWLLLNRTTRRPLKIPDSLIPTRLQGLPDDLLAGFERPEFLCAPDYERWFDVRASDLDYNQHVNNVCYLSWAIDTLPLAFIETYELKDLQISFLNEGMYGETIVSRTNTLTGHEPSTDSSASHHPRGEISQESGLRHQQSTAVFAHELMKRSSQQKLAVARSAWECFDAGVRQTHHRW